MAPWPWAAQRYLVRADKQPAADLAVAASVPGKHQGLDRQQQRLDAQDHGVNERHGVDHVQREPSARADVLRLQQLVIVAVGVGDAAAAGRNVLQSALVERLQEDQDGARPLSTDLRSMSWSPARNCPAAIKSCTSVTTIGMIVKGLETQVTSAIMPTFMICASIWPKPACRPAAPGLGRDQNAGRAHQRVDDVADPQARTVPPGRRRRRKPPSC